MHHDTGRTRLIFETVTANQDILEQYACGPVRLHAEDDYDRHLVFDHVVTLEDADQRERFGAVASAGSTGSCRRPTTPRSVPIFERPGSTPSSASSTG